jgi:hypothetical protein
LYCNYDLEEEQRVRKCNKSKRTNKRHQIFLGPYSKKEKQKAVKNNSAMNDRKGASCSEE